MRRSSRDRGRGCIRNASTCGIRFDRVAARARDGGEHPRRRDLERLRRAADLGDRVHRRDAACRPVHRRERHARIRDRHADGAPGRSGDLRRFDRDRQHLLHRRRRPHPPNRSAASDRRLGAIAARRGRASGSDRRGDRSVPRPGRRHRRRRGRGLARRTDAGARRRAVRPDSAGAGAARRHRRPHHVGCRLGRLSAGAVGHAPAGPRGVGGGVARGGRRAHRPECGRDRPVRRRRRAAGRGNRGRDAVAGRRGRRLRRRHPVVHRPRAGLDARDAARPAAGRPRRSEVRRRRGSRPRTPFDIPSARRAWRSGS